MMNFILTSSSWKEAKAYSAEQRPCLNFLAWANLSTSLLLVCFVLFSAQLLAILNSIYKAVCMDTTSIQSSNPFELTDLILSSFKEETYLALFKLGLNLGCKLPRVYPRALNPMHLLQFWYA